MWDSFFDHDRGCHGEERKFSASPFNPAVRGNIMCDARNETESPIKGKLELFLGIDGRRSLAKKPNKPVKTRSPLLLFPFSFLSVNLKTGEWITRKSCREIDEKRSDRER